MADTTLRKRRDDDIEALASKACALASVPIPDYADAMEREKSRSKKKYVDRFNIRDDEVIDDDVMGLLPGEEFDGDRNGIALAERTSQILSNFQDYVSGIGGEEEAQGVGNDPGEVIPELEDGGDGGGRRAGETTVFLNGGGGGGGVDGGVRPLKSGSTSSVGSSGGTTSGPLQREWDS